MKKFAIPFLLLSAGACVSPQQSCINRAMSEVRSLERGVQHVETNIARDHAVHRSTERFTYLTRCADAEGNTWPCEKVASETKETPVNLDIAEERRKLADLEARLSQAHRAMQDEVAWCRIAYPAQ